MPPVRVGVRVGSRPSSSCCTRTAAGKHEYTSASPRSRRGRPAWCSAARPSTAIAGHAASRSPGGQRDRLRAVEGDVREEPSVRWHAGLRSTGRRADDERRATGPLSTDWRARRCTGTRAGGCVDRAWRSRPLLRGAPKAASGLWTATALKRAHSAAISSRCSSGPEPARCGQRVLNEGVLLHRRQDDAGLELNRRHEVGRPLHDPVGWLALEVRFFAAAAKPAASFATHHDHRVVLARRHGRERVVEHLLLRDADLDSGVSAPGASRCAGPRYGPGP